MPKKASVLYGSSFLVKGGIGYVPENTLKKTQPGKLSEQLVSSVAAELR